VIVSRTTMIFGGVVYRMQVDARHAASLAQLAVLASRAAPALTEIDYQHSSNLPRARCEWLRRAIASGATFAISCDADTAFDARRLHDAIMHVRGTTAIGVAPVRMGGTTESNVTTEGADGTVRRLSMEGAALAGQAREAVLHGGFGLVVFGLGWFRAHWPEPTPEGVGWERSEDTALCDAVRARGGVVRALPVPTVHLAYGEALPR